MIKTLPIAGAYTALVTPFTHDGATIDFEAFDKLVEAQLAGGINGVVPCGTTGESPTLSDEEQAELVRRTVAAVGGRVPVLAGAGSNDTRKAIKLARGAVDAGADAVMIVMPYYNKPSQEGLVQHVLSVAREIRDTPIVLYNVPARSVADLSVDALESIVRQADNVVAVKDATGNIVRCQLVLQRLGARVTVMCGDDALTVGMMACGAKGVISVTSNVYPASVSAVCRLAKEGRWDDARKQHMALLAVHEVMFIEPSPGPVKAALASRGRVQLSLRLPMLPPTEACKQRVVEAMAHFESEMGR